MSDVEDYAMCLVCTAKGQKGWYTEVYVGRSEQTWFCCHEGREE